jgi:NAD(P)-dependent dehydrogenase (short-subunit alcohol dehydrogenase family)
VESFEGKVAVVTGGASGIGRGIALELARRGANIVVADVHEQRLAGVVEELQALGVQALGSRCDVTSDEDIDQLQASAFERFGRVDVLCNNAGVAVIGPPESVAMADWEWALQVNVLGIVRGVRAFVPAMLERGSGYVLNTASIAGVWAYTWDAAPYITSKFAAYGLSEVLARRLRPHGVGVSVLCPGLVSTNLAETARNSGVPEARRADWSYFPPDLADAAEPEQVGLQVAEGILAGQFAIFTHERDAQHYKSWRLDIDASLDAIIGLQATPPGLLDE